MFSRTFVPDWILRSWILATPNRQATRKHHPVERQILKLDSQTRRGVVGPRTKTGAGRVCLGLWLAVGLLLVGCQSIEPSNPRPRVTNRLVPTAGQAQFSASAAWKHMRALNQFGTRVSGSTGSLRTRAYLRGNLEDFGIALQVHRVSVVVGSRKAIELTHLTAVIPGRSPDVLLLAAHYDTVLGSSEAPRSNDQRASGAALLLELARVLAAGTTPAYTIWLSWIDGDALQAGSGASSLVRSGSQSLLDEWQREEQFSRIRIAIFFGNVGHRDLPFVRDIDSPRIYREIFWEAGRDLGFGEAFPADSQYEQLDTGRPTFAKASLRASIALANQRAPKGDGSDSAGGRETDVWARRPSAGFEAVGNVTLEALARIAAKLGRIDQFARSPLTAGRATSWEFMGRD